MVAEDIDTDGPGEALDSVLADIESGELGDAPSLELTRAVPGEVALAALPLGEPYNCEADVRPDPLSIGVAERLVVEENVSEKVALGERVTLGEGVTEADADWRAEVLGDAVVPVAESDGAVEALFVP